MESNTINSDWLIGFIEGEGNFNVALAKFPKNPVNPIMPVLQFRIFLREDDLDVLQKIQSFLGYGKIYKKDYSYSRKKGIFSQDQYAFYITNSDDLSKFRDFIKSNKLHSKKAKDAELFFKIFDLKLAKKHLNPDGFLEIKSLAEQMNSKNREHWKKKNV